MNVNDKVSGQYKASVRKAVAANGHSGWGQKDSVEVIEDLVGLLVSDEEVGEEGFGVIRAFVTNLVNPSAFCQVLETLSDGSGRKADGSPDKGPDGEVMAAHPAWVRREGKGKGRGVRGAGL